MSERSPWKKALKVAGIILGVLLLLQIGASFFLGPVLANELRSRIEEASLGAYQISNRTADLNLLNGSLIIKDLAVLPDSSLSTSGDKAFYQINIPEVRLSGMEVYQAFRDQKLNISSLAIEQPAIQLHAGSQKAQSDSADVFEKSLYELSNGKLSQLNIGSLEVQEGSFIYYPEASSGLDVFEARDIFLQIKAFKLDSAAKPFQDRSFFAEEIELGADIPDYKVVTADSLYEFMLGKIGIATHRSELLAGDIKIRPLVDKLFHGDSSQSDLPAWASIGLPRLRVEGVDLHDIYFNRKIKLESIKLIEPDFTLIQRDQPIQLFKNKNPLGLRALEKQIMPFFEGFEISQIELIDGTVRQQASWEDSSQSVSIKGLNISLEDFSLAPDTRNKLLRSADIRLEVERYDWELIPETYRISGNNLWLSTQSRFLLTDSLELIPGPRAYQVAQRGKEGPPDVYRISLPSLVIEGADANQAYFDRVLDVNKVYLGGPQVRLTNYPRVKREEVSKLAQSDFYDLISEQLESFSITNLEVDEGQFLFNKDNDASKNAFEVKDITVQVTNFRLDSTTRRRANLPFYADDINVNIDVEGYSLVLPDSLHEVAIGEIGVSTKDSIIFASAIRFTPTAKAHLQPDSLKKRLYDLFVPRFELQGLDVLELYLEKELHVDGVQLQEPLLRMHSYASESANATNSWKPEQAFEIIRPQLNALSIGRLSIEGGTFHHTRHVGKQLKDFSLPDIWMMLERFSLDSTSRMTADNFLFAEAIEARIRGFNRLLKDSVHSLSIGELGLASVSQELYLDGIRVTPTADSAKKTTARSLYDVFSPQIRIQGIDPYQLTNERRLQVDSILLQSPQLQIVNYPQVNKQKIDSLARADLYDLISGYLTSLEVDGFKVVDGKLELHDERIASGKGFKADDLDVTISEFKIDSLARQRSNNPFYATDIAINLDIEEYEWMLPDSSYRLQAGQIGFSSGGSSIFIDSLRLLPEQIAGQAAEVMIPQLQLQGVNLVDIYLNRRVELAAMRLIQPQISLPQALTSEEGSRLSKKEIMRMLNPDIFPSIEPVFNKIHIASVEAFNGQVQLILPDKTLFLIPDINFQLEEFRLDHWSQQRLWQFLFSKEINLDIRAMSYSLNEMYDIHLGGIVFQSCFDSLVLDSIQLIPRYGRYEFGKKLGYSTDRVDMVMREVRLRKVDIWPLLAGQHIDAEELIFDGVNFDIFRDRRHPDTVQVRKTLPQAWLRKLPVRVDIDTAFIQNSSITYSEHVDGAKKPGYFYVNDLKTKIFPITNDPDLLEQQLVAQIQAEARLMDNASLRANFNVPLADTTDAYSFAAVVGPWDLKELNPILEPTTFISVRNGKLQRMTYHVNANKYESRGRMRCYYTDLSISVLNRKRRGDAKGMQSFFANSLVADRNPKRTLRVGRINVDNDPYRSIINHWFRATQSGITSSITIKGKRDRIKDFLRIFEAD